MKIAILYDQKSDLTDISEKKIPYFYGNTKSVKYKQLLQEHIDKFSQTKEDQVEQLFWMKMPYGEYSLTFIWASAYKGNIENYYDLVYSIDDERLK